MDNFSIEVDRDYEIGRIEAPKAKSSDTAEITFSVDKEGTMIECHWNAVNEVDMGTMFGSMIAEICSGRYAGDILSILKEHLDNNPADKEFLEETVISWQTANELIALYSEESVDAPVVNPLKTFGASRFYKE
jgi:hypothetical protein